MATGIYITLPDEVLADVRNTAEIESRSVDDVLSDAAKKYLEDRSWEKLFDYGQKQAQALGIKESDIERLIAEVRAEKRAR